MSERDSVTDGGTSGDNSASAVPSVDDMIADSVASGNGARSSEQTDLEGLHFELVGDSKQPETVPPSVSDEPPKRGRGRPRKDGTSPGSERPATKRKAELAAELEKVQAELSAERARNDTEKIGELAKSIEFASYLAFGFAAQQRGPHWKISDAEAKDLGKTGAFAFAPYAQQITKQLPWMVFAGQLGTILWKRVEEDKKLVKLYGTRENPL